MLSEMKTSTDSSLSRNLAIADWTARLLIVAIFVAAAFPKLSGHPMTIELFSHLGVEPFGRLAAGGIEALAAVFLLFSRTKLLGAGLALITMVGAILSHLTVLGISLGPEDGGGQFALAWVVVALVSGVFYLNLSSRDRARQESATFHQNYVS